MQDGGFPPNLWILATTFGWSVGSLPTLRNIWNLSDFFQTVLILGVNGLLVGFLMGSLQWMALRQSIKLPKSWITATIFDCLFAEVFGVIFAVGFPFISLCLQGESLIGWDFLPFPSYMIYGGFFVGIFQSRVFSQTVRIGKRIGLLWFTGTWMGIGLGVFATGYASNFWINAALPNILSLFLGRISAGVVLALTTFILLQIINKYGLSGNRKVTATSL
jgi:hypothetical protein